MNEQELKALVTELVGAFNRILLEVKAAQEIERGLASHPNLPTAAYLKLGLIKDYAEAAKAKVQP